MGEFDRADTAGAGLLSNLKRLDLSNNQLTGEIPPWLGRMPNLEFLYLEGNQFTGCIPKELKQIWSVESDLTWCISLPGAPLDLTVMADGQTQIDLSWSVPEDDGGEAIAGYRIEVSEMARPGATWKPTPSLPAPATLTPA